MKITGRSTINTVLKDPEASEWLKGALRLALELKCNQSDVHKDALTLATLMQKRKHWPVKGA